MRLLLILALVAAALAALTLWRAASREAAAEAAFPPQGVFVTVDGLRVHAVVAGEGPDLVLIHGLSGNARDFSFRFVGAVQDRYRVIAFDRPGLGYSDPLPAGADGIVGQARHLAQAARLLGAERPLVLGHSYGGAVALAWAVHLPDRIAALVTVSAPSHPFDTPPPAFYRIAANPVGAALLAAFVPARVVRANVEASFAPQPAPDVYAAHLGAGLTLRRSTLGANARHRMRLLADIEALAPLYPRLTLPVEILHGTADTTVSIQVHAEALARDIPGAHLTRLPGSGHAAHHVALAQVIAALDRAAARAGLR